MLAKIDIKFIQNWSPLIKQYQKFDQVLSKRPSSGKLIKGYSEIRFDFGSAGSLTPYDNIVSGNDIASAITGTVVENQLPWVNKLREDMSELKLSAIGFQSNIGSLTPHIDGQEQTETVFHCKLNYIIDDFDACTYVQDGDNKLSYPSKKDTAWLIDTTKLHWVNGTGRRYIFQLAFHQKHSEVLDWFNSRPGLVYSS